MCRALNAKVCPLDRKAVVIKLAEISSEVKSTVVEMLKGKEFAITADHWTSIGNHNYLGVTAHYIDSE